MAFGSVELKTHDCPAGHSESLWQLEEATSEEVMRRTQTDANSQKLPNKATDRSLIPVTFDESLCQSAASLCLDALPPLLTTTNQRRIVPLSLIYHELSMRYP